MPIANSDYVVPGSAVSTPSQRVTMPSAPSCPLIGAIWSQLRHMALRRHNGYHNPPNCAFAHAMVHPKAHSGTLRRDTEYAFGCAAIAALHESPAGFCRRSGSLAPPFGPLVRPLAPPFDPLIVRSSRLLLSVAYLPCSPDMPFQFAFRAIAHALLRPIAPVDLACLSWPAGPSAPACPPTCPSTGPPRPSLSPHRPHA